MKDINDFLEKIQSPQWRENISSLYIETVKNYRDENGSMMPEQYEAAKIMGIDSMIKVYITAYHDWLNDGDLLK